MSAATNSAVLVAAEAERLALPLSPAAAERLGRYFDHLLRWSARLLLTGPRSAEALVQRHLADALILADQLVAADAIDVGAGGGLPGLAVLVLRPALKLTLVEANARKSSFLRDALFEFGLSGEVVAKRVEHAQLPRAQAAWSRATWAPAVWLSRAQPLLQPNGVAYVFAVSELPPPPAGFVLEGRRTYTLADGTPRVLGAYRLSEAPIAAAERTTESV